MKPFEVRDSESAGMLDLSPLPKNQRRAIDTADVDRRLHPPRATWWTRLREWARRVWRWFN